MGEVPESGGESTESKENKRERQRRQRAGPRRERDHSATRPSDESRALQHGVDSGLAGRAEGARRLSAQPSDPQIAGGA